MGCKYSKVIPRGKREESLRSHKRSQMNNPKSANQIMEITKNNIPELTTEEILKDLASKGLIGNTKAKAGGVAFDIGSTGLPLKPPRRLAKIEKKKIDTDIYTAEERALMAEIVRKDEAKEMGLKTDLKQDKAKRRRMFKEAEMKFKVENKRKAYEDRMKKLDEEIAEKNTTKPGLRQ